MGRAVPLQIGSRHFKTRGEAEKFFSDILNRYKPKDRVSEADESDLRALLGFHPNSAEKIGNGVDHFLVLNADHGTQCFYVVQKGDHQIKFSVGSCLDGAVAKQSATEKKAS
jgi:tRNA G26 N,N-dimethylase Trm1